MAIARRSPDDAETFTDEALGQLRARARSLALLGGVLADDIGAAYLDLLEALAELTPAAVVERWGRLFGLLAYEAELYPELLVGDAWQNHLLDRLIADENAFSQKAQRASIEQLGPALVAQTRRDLATLHVLFTLNGQALLEHCDEPHHLSGWDGFVPLGGGTPLHGQTTQALKRQLAAADDWAALVQPLAEHFYREGAGSFGRYRAFRWERRGHLGHLAGIAQPDPIRLDELIGYDAERQLLLENTEQFLDGYAANNVLLFGDRGTGKSSSVKALLQAYAGRGLRLLEVPKQLLGDFPAILAQLRGRRERFVIFVDDLSFEEHESIYKELKAVLEGGLEARPENVAIYATSNRRHLIVERFSDHDAPEEGEIHSMDTVQEKLSLSDRFGLRLFFISPNQQRYLEIVRGLAAQRSLAIAPDDLERRALQWATWQNGRSGRTARQFVDHLTGALARERRTMGGVDSPGSGYSPALDFQTGTVAN
jgi:predicted AAA+ superfamily ATPase